MSKVHFSDYRQKDLKNLVEDLGKNYYSLLSTLCDSALVYHETLNAEDAHASAKLYLNPGAEFLKHLQDFVNMRTGVVVPYIYELHAKENEGHNCSSCEGQCSFKHAAKLIAIRESQEQIKEKLLKVKQASVHLDNLFPETYTDLREAITRIESMLSELFYIEESSLVPKIQEAQTNINAHN